MLHFELLDESLDINKTQFYHLSIQVSLDGFLFAILDPENSRYLGLKRYGFEKANNLDKHFENLERILQQDPFLKKEYLSVSCIHNENRATLLPAALFDREHLKLYFEFNHVLNELDELHYNFLNQIDAYLVFPLNSEITSLILKSWLNTRFFHQDTPLIDALISRENGNGSLVGINFNEGHFDIVVTENRQLKYQNNFSFRSDEDLIYFMLFVFDKLEMDQEKTPVLLSGEIDKFSERLSTLGRYFKQLSYQAAPAGFQYPPSFHKLQEHSLMNLLSIYHCG